jgi:hypothetical protein
MALNMTLKQRIGQRVDKWTWYQLGAATIAVIGFPIVLLVVGPDFIPIFSNPGVWSTIALLTIFEAVLGVGVWVDWSKSRTNDPWLQRGVGIGVTAGGCIGNIYLPLFGFLLGAVAGALLGLVGGGAICVVRFAISRRTNSKSAQDRTAQLIVLGSTLVACLASLKWVAPHFDDPASKYLSNGEFERMYASEILWPALLFVSYILIAGPPTPEHPLSGEVTKRKLVVLKALLALAVVSSFLIGIYWLADNFPHPD